ncbi:MAG: metalloregulator ArsR/SmtB family transcription factor [Pseudomonadota bacterium]
MTEQLIFRAIADPTRRSIMTLLSAGERSLNDISAEYEMSRPAVTKHLRVLEEGGLIRIRARGRERLHSLQPETLKAVSDWVNYFSQFWDEKLADLKQIVEADDD